jgi:hypothetical protein
MTVNGKEIGASIGKGFRLVMLAAAFAAQHAAAADVAAQLASPSALFSAADAQAVAAHQPKRADFMKERASVDARQTADWVVDSNDNHAMPFVIVDKSDAKVYVFDAQGRLSGAAPALLGLAIGDDSVPGIGDRPMSQILPEERTTPAGRFVAEPGHNSHGVDILWVDYDAAISLHRVVTNIPKDRRLERLAAASPLEHRISYGCINVPARFYDKVVRPAFTRRKGIVYVLPETRSARAVFASYDVEAQHELPQTVSQPVLAQTAVPLGSVAK